MDKIAIISDIHGNIPALDSVLSDIKTRGINRIFCLGDIAGKGPCPVEALDKIRKHCEVVIKGNWDYFISEKHSNEIFAWHYRKLGKKRSEYMKTLPMYKEFYMSGKLVRLCHASPNDVFHRVYVNSKKEDRLKLFEKTPTNENESDVVGYGDIHGAYIDNFDGKTLFNVGSVGNPLDMTQASYGIIEGIYDSKEKAPLTISIIKVPYDIEEAIRQANETDMPEKKEYIKELRTGVYRGRKQ